MADVQDAEYTVEGGGADDTQPNPGMAIEAHTEQAISQAGFSGMLRPVAKPAEVMAAQEETRELIQEILKEGRDFGKIPGTKKGTLLKPGAERTCAAYGCAPKFSILEQEIDHDRVNRYPHREWEWHPSIRGKKIFGEEVMKESRGLYRYVLLCELIHRESGFVVGSGVGSCSSLESKYISRPRDVENTILKMAKKRCYIDATLTTFGLSDQFTQDLEDLPREAIQNGDNRGQSNGNGGGSSSSQDWSLDSPTVGKNKAGETWKQTCVNDPGYVAWSIGRVEGKEGMHVLDGPKRQALGAELDRLDTELQRKIQDGQAEGSQHQGGDASIPDDTHLHVLRTSIIETGKHKDKSWLVVAKDDFTYLDKAQNSQWGKRMLKDPALKAAVQWATQGGLERMKLSPTPEKEVILDPAELFVQMTSVPGVTMKDLEAFALAHPHLPEDMNTWDESHYTIAVRAFQAVSAKGGVTYAIERAHAALSGSDGSEQPEEKEDPPSTIPDEVIAEGDRALNRADIAGMEIHTFQKDMSEAVERGDAAGYEVFLEDLKKKYFAHQASKGSHKPDAAQTSAL